MPYPYVNIHEFLLIEMSKSACRNRRAYYALDFSGIP